MGPVNAGPFSLEKTMTALTSAIGDLATSARFLTAIERQALVNMCSDLRNRNAGTDRLGVFTAALYNFGLCALADAAKAEAELIEQAKPRVMHAVAFSDAEPDEMPFDPDRAARQQRQLDWAIQAGVFDDDSRRVVTLPRDDSDA
jgi:hypothetical protein